MQHIYSYEDNAHYDWIIIRRKSDNHWIALDTIERREFRMKIKNGNSDAVCAEFWGQFKEQ